jgi:hypothetical protein
MTTREPRSHTSEPSADAKSVISVRLGDFAMLDKVLLLEASVKRSPGVPDRVRDSLLHQLAALKNDLRAVCMMLVGEAPARAGDVPLPVWARPDDISAASEEISDAG